MRVFPVVCLLSFGLGAALLTVPAVADSASMFRGNPQLTGVYDTQPAYSVDAVKFSFKTGGTIRSTPAVADGVLYFGSGDGNFYALDARTGQERWRFRTAGGIFSSAAIAAGAAYFASRDGYLYALDVGTGKQRWKFPLGKDLGEGHYWDFYLSSPIVAGQNLYIGSGDGNVYALDARSGKTRWKFAAGARVRATPALSADTLIVATMSGVVYALNAKDGTQRWKFATKGATNKFEDKGNDTTSIAASPSVGDGVVTVGSRDGFIYGINLADGSQLWQTTHDGSSWILSTAIENGTAYIGSGSAAIVQAADLKTGTEKWRFKTRGAVFSSLTIAGDVLYFGDFGGSIHALDKTSGAHLWSYSLGERIFGTPVVADGIVYCGSDNGVMVALAGSMTRKPASADPKRLVYWEGRKSDKAFNWFQDNVDVAILNYFKSAGYEQVDAKQLATIMSEQITSHTRSVVVFADNRIPANIVEEETPHALIRKYLDAGGKVALLGTNPLAYRADPKTGVVENIDFAPAQAVFGIQFPKLEKINGYYASHATAEGEKWGLHGFSVGAGAIEPTQATSVLAEDEFDMASSWVKNYGGPEGTGLLQLNVPRLAPTDFSQYRAAIEHGIY